MATTSVFQTLVDAFQGVVDRLPSSLSNGRLKVEMVTPANVPALVDSGRPGPGIQAGTGDATVTVTGRLLQVVMVGGDAAGSLQINDEDEVTVPANTPLTFEPRGVWTDPTVTITGSASYLVESAP